MLISEMEALLKNLDVRVGRIEQFLPTLATKADFERFATKTDLERFATKADLAEFARKSDLADFARKSDLDGSERRLRVLFEHFSGSVDTLAVHLSDQMHRLSDLVERLDRDR